MELPATGLSLTGLRSLEAILGPDTLIFHFEWNVWNEINLENPVIIPDSASPVTPLPARLSVIFPFKLLSLSNCCMRMRQEEKTEATRWFYLAAVNTLFLPCTTSRALPMYGRTSRPHRHETIKPSWPVRCLQSDIPVTVRVCWSENTQTEWVTNKHIQDDYTSHFMYSLTARCLLDKQDEKLKIPYL